MTKDHVTSLESTPTTEASSKPNRALKRLERLVGRWEMQGRTLDSQVDNISGWVEIAWLPGGYFLEQRGEMNFMGFKGQSLEVVGYDPSTETFPSTVYSSMDGVPLRYEWDVQGDVVTHWTTGAKYTGTFSTDGRTLVGGWRPDVENEASAGNAYDVTMKRVA